ncbi:hypothetical protein PZB74_22160 [Porifericola rhodea]|uniref:3D domain-containing protein n=1 Tax=Porifericola rhodea TaxID=930972 RepID=UPI002666D1CA|nr:hypothetical protein [Porifericola rhodea]WKN31654.1 hypothetical protein PZB74_22160 [Porifericola rhodea]
MISKNLPNGFILCALSLLILSACAETKEVEVTATAYNSVEVQTKKGDPATAAWGDKLKPGMKTIAVSRDLLKQEGFEHNTKVKIEGLSGTYRVLDKMNRRWEKRIDIYMGNNVEKALDFGKQEVVISWKVD